MADFLKSWISMIAYSGIAGGIILLLLPRSRFENNIKLIFGIIMIIAVFAPLIRGDWKVDAAATFFENSENEYEVSQSLLDKTEKVLDSEISGYLEKEGFGNIGIESEISYDKEKFKVEKLYLITSFSEEIKNKIIGEYNLPSEVIIFKEEKYNE